MAGFGNRTPIAFSDLTHLPRDDLLSYYKDHLKNRKKASPSPFDSDSMSIGAASENLYYFPENVLPLRHSPLPPPPPPPPSVLYLSSQSPHSKLDSLDRFQLADLLSQIPLCLNVLKNEHLRLIIATHDLKYVERGGAGTRNEVQEKILLVRYMKKHIDHYKVPRKSDKKIAKSTVKKNKNDFRYVSARKKNPDITIPIPMDPFDSCDDLSDHSSLTLSLSSLSLSSSPSAASPSPPPSSLSLLHPSTPLQPPYQPLTPNRYYTSSVAYSIETELESSVNEYNAEMIDQKKNPSGELSERKGLIEKIQILIEKINDPSLPLSNLRTIVNSLETIMHDSTIRRERDVEEVEDIEVGEVREVGERYKETEEVLNLENCPMIVAEKSLLEREIKISIQIRLNNYKQEIRKSTGLLIHYADGGNINFANRANWAEEQHYVQYWLKRIRKQGSLRCHGTCIGEGNNICKYGIVVDGTIVSENDPESWKKMFKTIEMDHCYEQSSIALSINFALKYAIDMEKNKQNNNVPLTIENIQTWMNSAKEDPNSETTTKVMKFFQQYVNWKKICDDLYGDNIIIRCPNCHSLAEHIPFDPYRYLNSEYKRKNGTV